MTAPWRDSMIRTRAEHERMTMSETLDEWTGDPDELPDAGTLLDDPERCEKLFASKREAFACGVAIQRRDVDPMQE
jgi:hypothetical protein